MLQERDMEGVMHLESCRRSQTVSTGVDDSLNNIRLYLGVNFRESICSGVSREDSQIFWSTLYSGPGVR